MLQIVAEMLRLKEEYTRIASSTRARAANTSFVMALSEELQAVNTTCIEPDHPEIPGTSLTIAVTVVVVTALVVMTILFEVFREEWSKRMHASLKAVVRNVFGELTVLGFIGLLMFLTTKLGKGQLDKLSNKWFKGSCFQTNLWCEDGDPALVCPENVLVELTESIHMVLFLIMLLFLIQAILVIRQGQMKMKKWRAQK